MKHIPVKLRRTCALPACVGASASANAPRVLAQMSAPPTAPNAVAAVKNMEWRADETATARRENADGTRHLFVALVVAKSNAASTRGVAFCNNQCNEQVPRAIGIFAPRCRGFVSAPLHIFHCCHSIWRGWRRRHLCEYSRRIGTRARADTGRQRARPAKFHRNMFHKAFFKYLFQLRVLARP